MSSKKVLKPLKKFLLKVAERFDSLMVVIYSHAQTNTTSVFTNSTQLNLPQNITSKHILVKLDVSNGWMMTLALSLVDGMVVYSCGNFTSTLTKVEMAYRKKETQFLNSS